MGSEFTISAESTVDLPYSYMAERDIPILFYSYQVDGTEYPDDMGRDPEALPQFYRFLDEGKLPSTSQINTGRYLEFFEGLLQKGDLLHINFGSGMTTSVNNAFEAADELREKYPDRKIVVIDSYCSSSGYGMLVDYAADMRDRGCSLDEIIEWVEAHCHKIHHQFFCTDLKYFRRSGRISGAAATVASVLGICPIMRLDDGGRIIVYDKVRGKNKAIKRTIDTMREHAEGGADYSGKCFVCNSNCPEIAEQVKAAVAEAFPHIDGDIRICDIGTIIASHSGPGTCAVFFIGDDRAPDDSTK